MLNALVKKVSRALAAGGSVLIDDQNFLASVRERLLNGILERGVLGRSETMCVACDPEGGRLHCEWSNEWSMAEVAMGARTSYLPLADTEAAAHAVYPLHRKRALSPWFSRPGERGASLPSPDSLRQEGFGVSETRKLPLRPALHGSFASSCLFIDGSCLLSSEIGAGLTPVPGAAAALSRWRRDNRSSRIVVLLQPASLFERRQSDEDENLRLLSIDPLLRPATLAALRALGSQVRRSTCLRLV